MEKNVYEIVNITGTAHSGKTNTLIKNYVLNEKCLVISFEQNKNSFINQIESVSIHSNYDMTFIEATYMDIVNVLEGIKNYNHTLIIDGCYDPEYINYIINFVTKNTNIKKIVYTSQLFRLGL